MKTNDWETTLQIKDNKHRSERKKNTFIWRNIIEKANWTNNIKAHPDVRGLLTLKKAYAEALNSTKSNKISQKTKKNIIFTRFQDFSHFALINSNTLLFHRHISSWETHTWQFPQQVLIIRTYCFESSQKYFTCSSFFETLKLLFKERLRMLDFSQFVQLEYIILILNRI